MNKHLNQRDLNEEFVAAQRKSFPNNFNDWKVTAVFYAATHHIRGCALSKGVTIGGSHKEVFEYIKNENGGEQSVAYKSFRVLYRNSRDCRYNGFTTRHHFELFSKIKLDESLTMYAKIKSIFAPHQEAPVV